jgi:chromosome segregation ATPase
MGDTEAEKWKARAEKLRESFKALQATSAEETAALELKLSQAGGGSGRGEEELQGKITELEQSLASATSKADKDVETWKKRAEKLRDSLNTTKAEKAEIEKQLSAGPPAAASDSGGEEALQAKVKDLEKVTAALSASTEEAAEEVETWKKRAEKLRDTVKQRDAEKAELEASLASGGSQAARGGTGEHGELQGRIVELEQALTDAETDVETWKKRAQKLRESFKALQEEKAPAGAGAPGGGSDLDEQVRQLTAALAAAGDELKGGAGGKAAKDVETWKKRAETQKTKAKEAQDELQAAQAELAELKEELKEAQQGGGSRRGSGSSSGAGGATGGLMGGWGGSLTALASNAAAALETLGDVPRGDSEDEGQPGDRGLDELQQVYTEFSHADCDSHSRPFPCPRHTC